MGRLRRALLRLSAMRCLSCGTEVAEGARFCPSCGQPLRAGADERRIVTVLFADLVGFTTLSESRDPEQVKNLVDRCFERLVADVRAYGGRHAVIHPDLPPVANLGYLVDGSVYHPGDSFDVPADATVDTLFVPVSAIRDTNRLVSALPGMIAGPEVPPFISPLTESRRNSAGAAGP